MRLEALKSSGFFSLALLAAALGAAFLLLRRYEPFDQHVPEVIGLALAAGAIYLGGVYWAFRPTRPETRASLILILGAGLLFRLTLVGAAPTLSDDLYRHQWEGRIQAAGWNPYLVTPADPRLAGLRDPGFSRIPGPNVPSAYPPLAELYFYLLALAGGGSTPLTTSNLSLYKWAALALDLAAMVLLLLLLRARGEPLARVLVYAWCPLVVLEFAGNGHYDALVLVALLVANLFIIKQRGMASMAGLAAATATKWFAGLALPVFLTRSGWRHLAVFAATCALIVLPYGGAGRNLIAGLVAYGEQWRNNESLFRLLRWATQRDDIAAGLALGAVVGLMLHAAQARVEPLRACYWLVGAILLLSPSVFPWYVTWLVPFLCFFPRPAGFLFTVTVLLAYHVVIGYRALGVWEYQGWLVALEYAPVYGLLLAGALRRKTTGDLRG